MGLAQGARRHGAQILQDVEVIGIVTSNSRVTGVQTSKGEIAAPVVIDAAGPWGGLVAAMAGVPTNMTPEHHQVGFVEVPTEVTWPHLMVIDALKYIYFRPETGRLSIIGASFANRNIGFDELDTFSEHLTNETRYSLLERLCARFPGMEKAGVRKGHAGVYVSTLDEHALMGLAPGVEGFYLATGFSGQGFKMAPGVGQAMAELILNGHTEVADITPLRVTRFDPV
jgi:sarcosine oxidase subunit beta